MAVLGVRYEIYLSHGEVQNSLGVLFVLEFVLVLPVFKFLIKQHKIPFLPTY
jgi:hypothetical protein